MNPCSVHVMSLRWLLLVICASSLTLRCVCSFRSAVVRSWRMAAFSTPRTACTSITIRYYEEVSDSIDNDDLLNYFEATWIGVRARGARRRNPRFRIELWNVHDSVVDGK